MKKVILLMCTAIFCGCSWFITDYSRIQKSFEVYTGENTTIRELIDIDGYYVAEVSSFQGFRPITYNINMMFFEDGMFLYDFVDVNAENRPNQESDIEQYFREILNDEKIPIDSVIFSKVPYNYPPERVTVYRSIADDFSKWQVWGTYHIYGDTIVAKYAVPEWYRYEKEGNRYYAFEIRFKVIDKHNITCFSIQPIALSKSEQRSIADIPVLPLLPYHFHFVKTEVVPPSNSWLKEKDWFWNKKSDN